VDVLVCCDRVMRMIDVLELLVMNENEDEE